MIQDTESLKKLKILQLYKESIKSPFKCYYYIMAFFIAYAIMAIISSVNLKDKYGYYENLQIAIIILVCYTSFFKCLGFFVLQKKELTNCVFLLAMLIFMTTNVPPILQLNSFIIGSLDKYCGYLISHQGQSYPHSIIFYLERYSPSCSQMEANGNLQEQIKYYSMKAIIHDCSIYQTVESCYQFNTLKVENWNDMFVVQISKHVQATQKIEQEIRQNLLNQSSQSQVCQNQPVYQQVLPCNPQFYSQQPNIQCSFQAYSNQQLNYNHPQNFQNQQIQNQNQVIIIGQPINS
ncbi:hypothetical protein ABPG74_021130 [Tetrahymena malaccensis]